MMMVVVGTAVATPVVTIVPSPTVSCISIMVMGRRHLVVVVTAVSTVVVVMVVLGVVIIISITAMVVVVVVVGISGGRIVHGMLFGMVTDRLVLLLRMLLQVFRRSRRRCGRWHP